MKLAVNLWTVYGWNLPEPVSADVLRALARMGSQGVELVIDDGANSAETLLNRRQELSALLAEFHWKRQALARRCSGATISHPKMRPCGAMAWISCVTVAASPRHMARRSY